MDKKNPNNDNDRSDDASSKEESQDDSQRPGFRQVKLDEKAKKKKSRQSQKGRAEARDPPGEIAGSTNISVVPRFRGLNRHRDDIVVSKQKAKVSRPTSGTVTNLRGLRKKGLARDNRKSSHSAGDGDSPTMVLAGIQGEEPGRSRIETSNEFIEMEGGLSSDNQEEALQRSSYVDPISSSFDEDSERMHQNDGDQGLDMPLHPSTQEEEEDLVEALPISIQDEGPQYVAEEVDPEELERIAIKTQKEQQCRRIGYFLVCISLTTLALVLGFTLSSQNTSTPIAGTNIENQTAQENETMAPTPWTFADKVKSLLPESSIVSLQQATSPQSRALEWMIADPFIGNYSDQRLVQRFALASFFYSTGGETDWFHNRHWLSYQIHECFWWPSSQEAIEPGSPGAVYLTWLPVSPPQYDTCHNTSDLETGGEYMALDLVGNNLVGTLPDEFYLLTALSIVYIGINSDLSGSLAPGSIEHLSNLVDLNVQNTGFTGSLPSELGLLSNLKGLSVQATKISGTIPTELGLLSNLDWLATDLSNVSGEIPSELGQLSNLHRLSMDNPNLHGPIPLEIFNVTALRSLVIGNMTNPGSIPTELGQLTNLLILQLTEALFTGPIPSEIGELTNLELVYVAYNLFSSTIPTTIKNLKNLYALRLDQNILSGTVPTELGAIKLLGNPSPVSATAQVLMPIADPGLWLSANLLTGTIPSHLSQMQFCQDIVLYGNGLRGTIPTELGGLNRLANLRAGGNFLTGPIPSQLGLAIDMESLSLYDNKLTSSIPSELYHWRQLYQFDVANNFLTGPILDKIVGWSATLETMDISGNQFTGTLPELVCLLGEENLFFDCSDTFCGCSCECPEMTDEVVLHTLQWDLSVKNYSSLRKEDVPEFFQLNQTKKNVSGILRETVPSSEGVKTNSSG